MKDSTRWRLKRENETFRFLMVIQDPLERHMINTGHIFNSFHGYIMSILGRDSILINSIVFASLRFHSYISI